MLLGFASTVSHLSIVSFGLRLITGCLGLNDTHWHNVKCIPGISPVTRIKNKCYVKSISIRCMVNNKLDIVSSF